MKTTPRKDASSWCRESRGGETGGVDTAGADDGWTTEGGTDGGEIGPDAIRVRCISVPAPTF